MEASSKEKDDHLSPTNGEIPKQNNEKEQEPDLSHDELQNRLDLYSFIGGSERPFFDVQKMKAKYEKAIKQIESNRTKADIHYAQGMRSGLPHARYESIKITYERQDQTLRNDVAMEAKAYYQNNNSLSKSFDAQKHKTEELKKVFERSKNKGMDREK